MESQYIVIPRDSRCESLFFALVVLLVFIFLDIVASFRSGQKSSRKKRELKMLEC